MRDFNKVSPTLWQSAHFQRLRSDHEKFLFLYLLTCPHNNSAGCFRLSDGYACDDLGWEQDLYAGTLRTLVDAELVDRDSENQVVLIERWFRHNPPMNDSHRIGIVRLLEKVPSDRLRAKAYDALETAQRGTGKRKKDDGRRTARQA